MMTPLSIVAAGGSLIDLDATFFIQLGIFLVVFLLMRSLLFRPVIQLIEKRREVTVGKREEAEKFERESAALQEEFDRQMAEIRSSAGAEKERVVEQARRQERDILLAAREDSRSIVEDAKKDASKQAEKVSEEIRGEIDSLAGAVASRILGRQVVKNS